MFINAGMNLIANQLVQGGNTLNEIMTNVPDGCVLSKYDNRQATWFQSVYMGGQRRMVAGEHRAGARGRRIFTKPNQLPRSPFPGRFSRRHPRSRFRPTPPGWSASKPRPRRVMKTSRAVRHWMVLPCSGGRPWRTRSFVEFDYFGGNWSPDTPPVINVGESVWAAPCGRESAKDTAAAVGAGDHEPASQPGGGGWAIRPRSPVGVFGTQPLFLPMAAEWKQPCGRDGFHLQHRRGPGEQQREL